MTDQLDLDAIDTAADAATPGPWGTYESGWVIDIAADLEETGSGYRARRGVCRVDEEPLDNDPTHRGWTAEEDWAQVQADAAYIAAMSPEVAKALVAEVRRLRAQVVDLGGENAKLIRWHREDGAYEQRLREQHDRDVAELNRLRARVWELERPAVEKQRDEVRDSYAQLAAQCREDRDFEGAFDVDCRLREREEQWKAEDAANQPTARAARSAAV